MTWFNFGVYRKCHTALWERDGRLWKFETVLFNLVLYCYTRFYNPRKSQCEKFVYGGCLPNRNNFVTLEECENFCHPDKSPSEDEIDAPPKPGAGNINGKDPYLEQGATIVHRIGEVENSSSTNPVSPRSLLLSDGPSGEVESSSWWTSSFKGTQM